MIFSLWQKTKVYWEIKKTYEKSFVTKKLNVLIQKILYFISIPVKCILKQVFNEIVDNQDLYRNKDDVWNFLKLNFKFFNLKDYIFNK